MLVGFMGAGKSTVGRLLAARLGVRFADSDAVIEQRERALAAGHLRRRRGGRRSGRSSGRWSPTCSARDLTRTGVVALGGGAVQDAATRALLGDAFVAYLEVSYRQVLARVGGDPGRPVLARPDLELVYASRVPAYLEVADVTVATDGLRPAAVADAVAAAVRG